MTADSLSFEYEEEYALVNKKTLYIVRGIPGSGLQLVASQLSDTMFSPDDLFFTIGDGEYEFDPSQVKEAHEQCLRNILNAMRRGIEKIAVYHTFTKRKDYYKYIKAAKAAGYIPLVVTTESSGFPGTRNVSTEKRKLMWQRHERHELEEEE